MNSSPLPISIRGGLAGVRKVCGRGNPRSPICEKIGWPRVMDYLIAEIARCGCERGHEHGEQEYVVLDLGATAGASSDGVVDLRPLRGHRARPDSVRFASAPDRHSRRCRFREVDWAVFSSAKVFTLRASETALRRDRHLVVVGVTRELQERRDPGLSNRTGRPRVLSIGTARDHPDSAGKTGTRFTTPRIAAGVRRGEPVEERIRYGIDQAETEQRRRQAPDVAHGSLRRLTVRPVRSKASGCPAWHRPRLAAGRFGLLKFPTEKSWRSVPPSSSNGSKIPPAVNVPELSSVSALIHRPLLRHDIHRRSAR